MLCLLLELCDPGLELFVLLTKFIVFRGERLHILIRAGLVFSQLVELVGKLSDLMALLLGEFVRFFHLDSQTCRLRLDLIVVLGGLLDFCELGTELRNLKLPLFRLLALLGELGGKSRGFLFKLSKLSFRGVELLAEVFLLRNGQNSAIFEVLLGGLELRLQAGDLLELLNLLGDLLLEDT